MSYALTVTVDLPFESAVERTRDALADSGFGVVSDIDMHATFAAKLGAPAAEALGDYRILGACNPSLAQKALGGEPDIGLLLPCNVVVRREPGATSTTVQAVDPASIRELSDSPVVAEVADDAGIRLRAALDLVSRPAPDA